MSNAPCEINELDTRKPELAQALADLGGFFYEGGVKEYGEWAKALRREVGQRVSEAALQTAWIDVKNEVARARDAQRTRQPIPKPSNFVEILAGRIGTEKAQKFLEDIADENGEPLLLQKLLDNAPLSASERKLIADSYRKYTQRPGKPGSKTTQTQTLAAILTEFRKKSNYRPRLKTAQEVRDAARQRIEQMQATGKPSKPGAPRKPNPLIDVATAEYAKGAKSLDAWAKGVEKRLGETLPDNVREDLFREAARRFAVDSQPVERIRREMAQKIESEVLKTRPPLVRAFKTLEGYRSAMRSIVTSVDLSGLGNQGGILAIARPTLATGSRGHAGAIRHMIEAAKSEDNIAMLSADITTNQEVKYGDKEFYKKVGLELSDTGAGADLTSKEENYLSNMAAKLPLVAGSERAYSAVLNSLRSATFDTLYESGMSQDEARDLARYINVATGRGDLSHSVKMATPMLANIFFSPRYAISRVQYLTAQPIFAASTSRTRRLIAKEYARYLSKIALAVTLGMAGGLVKSQMPEKDKDGRPLPMIQRIMLALTSPDTGVFKFPIPATGGGELRFDFYSSNKPWVNLAATLIQGKRVTQDGEIANAGFVDTVGRFTRSKLAPDLGLAVNWMPDEYGNRTDFIYNPTTVEGTLRGLLPMSLSEVIKGFAELGTQPAEANKLLIGLGLIGSAAVSATGFKTTYRNKTQEQAERATAKEAQDLDPLYNVLDQGSPIRRIPGVPNMTPIGSTRLRIRKMEEDYRKATDPTVKKGLMQGLEVLRDVLRKQEAGIPLDAPSGGVPPPPAYVRR